MKDFEKPYLWFLYQLTNEKQKSELLNYVESKIGDEIQNVPKAKHILLEKMVSNYPEHFESREEFITRVSQCKVAMAKLIDEQKYGKLTPVIVCHSSYLAYFTAEGFDEKFKPVDCKTFTNCEIYEYNIDVKTSQ